MRLRLLDFFTKPQHRFYSNNVPRHSVTILPSPLPPHPFVLTSIGALPASSSWLLPIDTASCTINLSFFSSYPDPIVTLEHTTQNSFEHLEVPLSYFLDYLVSPPNAASSSTKQHTLYLAQFSPPPFLAASVSPPPDLFPASSRLARTSIWLGRTPTFTPLHEDPDDNVIYQLCGRKTIRLFPPQVGRDVLDRVRQGRGGSERGGRLRGAEMMTPGPKGERDELERLVWDADEFGHRQGLQATIEEGEALFIPRHWFHSVRGETRGPEEELSVSVNWWFR